MKKNKFLARASLWAAALSISWVQVAKAADVLVLDDSVYVDSNGNTGAEADNIAAAIDSLGHNVTLLASAGDLATENLTVYDAVVIPEMENAAFDLNQIPLEGNLRNFVLNGGRLIINREVNNDNDLSVLNDVFQFNVTQGTFDIPTTADVTIDDTLFQTGPANLPENNLVSCLAVDSLPVDAQAIYSNGNDASVVLFPFGQGEVISLGWDWNNSNPPWDVGGQDGGWHLILALALKNVDLGITATASTLTPIIGQEVSVDIEVNNPYFWVATGVTVSATLPANLELLSHTPPLGFSPCVVSLEVDLTTITCTGDLTGTANLGLVILAKTEGDASISIAVDSQQIELEPADNAFSLDFTVQTDTDGDAVADGTDNCPSIGNTDQADADLDGIGDACEALDSDGDDVLNDEDNCPIIANEDQADEDGDGAGDICDLTPALAASINGGGCSFSPSTGKDRASAPLAWGMVAALILAFRFWRSNSFR